MWLSEFEGELLVKIARQAVEEYVKDRMKLKPPKVVPDKFLEKSGVFVTINKFYEGEKELRGCIGFPYADRPLIEAIIDSAISAAAEDPRFPPIVVDELDHIVVEVSVLTPLELIQVTSPKEYPSKIKVGRDGLVVKWTFGSGLLLPQVPVEYNWSAEEFLSHTCMKAGAMPDCWLMRETKIYRFQAEIYEELSPRGRIVGKKLE